MGGPADNYWLYPTQSDSAPGNVIGSGVNQANYYAGDYSVTQSSNYSSSQNYLTDRGAFSSSASFYGTFDQGGNAWEWNDAVISGSYRGLRVGSWAGPGPNSNLQSSNRNSLTPDGLHSDVGFRVASIPEPSTVGLIVLAGAGWLVWKRRNAAL